MRTRLPLPPTTNNIYRSCSIGKRTIVYMTKEAKEWKKNAQWLLKKGKPTKNNVEVYVYFYLIRDRDVDNLKLLIDTLENTKVENDSQIIALHIFKEKSKEAYCEIEVNEC